VARIVRPRGGFAFFWNVVDEARSDLIAGERRLVTEYGIDGEDIRPPGPRPETADAIRSAPGFGEPRFIQLQHSVPMTGASYLGWTRTKSHLRTAPDDLQQRFVSDFERMLRAHGVGSDDRVDVPFVVDCWIAPRNDA
jgi:hypothetical protein